MTSKVLRPYYCMEKKRHELQVALASVDRLCCELESDFANDPAYRKATAQTVKSVHRRVQTPTDRAWNIACSPAMLAALRTALDAGWLDGIARADGRIGITAKVLAAGKDVVLTIRILRLLCAHGLIRELPGGPTIYAPTEMTRVFTAPGFRDVLRCATDNWVPSFALMPQYFANTDYHSSSDAINCVFTLAQGRPLAATLAAEPSRRTTYENFKSVIRYRRRRWLDVFPIEKLKVNSREDVLLIDLVGGRGEMLTELHARRSELKLAGLLVLQDDEARLSEIPPGWQHGFTAFPHNIFTPQPASCRHARAMYIRLILHDWPDDACVVILKHLKEAMKPGYTTLLIDDVVLPDTGCSALGAAFDLGHMVMKSGRERTKGEWTELVGRVDGLRIDKIWPLDEGAESIIEVVRIL